MIMLSPVVIFAYRRPDHLRNTLASLMRCEGFAQSPIIVYCDGPRNDSEVESVTATRELAKNLLGEHAEYHFSEVNLGLSRSVIAGVSQTVERFGRVIVVEDDLELHPAFLTFMNQALDRYACEDRVFQISGYQFDVPELKDTASALFLPFTVSWGWATWQRAWAHFDPLASGWEKLRDDKDLRRRFNLDGVYDYATMLVRQMSGLRDSWAVRWYWTVFKAKGLVLFPPSSLVSNTGFDGSGTHGRGVLRQFSQARTALEAPRIIWPESVTLDAEYYDCVKRALCKQNGGWIGKTVDTLRWWKTISSRKPSMPA
ncbi:MAG: glycosyltransferase family protein [Thiobacillus sp.]